LGRARFSKNPTPAEKLRGALFGVALAARDPDRTPASPERLLYAKRAFERLGAAAVRAARRREITHVALDFRPIWLQPVLLGRPRSAGRGLREPPEA
jgi:hypothetical protein